MNRPSTYWINGIKPKIGDKTNGINLGLKSRGIFIWSACPQCKSERWIGKNQITKFCMSCAAINRKNTGEKNPRWNGGVRQDKDGYRYITVDENHPFINMSGKVFIHGKYRYYIAEHRLVMAFKLNRPLNKTELVHHLNGIKDDNRPENLELMKCHKDHLPSMNIQHIISSLEKRVTMLEAENILLKSQLSNVIYDNPELNSELNR
jgi:hypothetical protein